MKKTKKVDTPAPFLQHLEELRRHVIKGIILLILTSVLVYIFIEGFLPIVTKPAGSLVFIAPLEMFIVKIKFALFMGFLFALPYLSYITWSYVHIALTKEERKYIPLFGILALLLFYLAVVFSFLVMVPIGIKLLLRFALPEVKPMISINKYISFVMMVTTFLGFTFQIPIILLLLVKIRVISIRTLSYYRRHAVVLAFIISAILTPPDVVTQVLIALPLILLYELSLLLCRIFSSKN